MTNRPNAFATWCAPAGRGLALNTFRRSRAKLPEGPPRRRTWREGHPNGTNWTRPRCELLLRTTPFIPTRQIPGTEGLSVLGAEDCTMAVSRNVVPFQRAPSAADAKHHQDLDWCGNLRGSKRRAQPAGGIARDEPARWRNYRRSAANFLRSMRTLPQPGVPRMHRANANLVLRPSLGIATNREYPVVDRN